MRKFREILFLLMLYPGLAAAQQASEPVITKAEPAEYGRLFVGGQSGVSFVSNGLKSNVHVGIQAGWRLLPNLSFGARVARIFLKSQETSIAGTTLKTDDHITLVLGMLNVHPFEEYPGVFIGARGGVGISGFSGSFGSVSASDSESNVAWGPAIGADVRIGHGITIGAEADLLFKGTSDEINAAVQSSRGASTIAEVFGTIKYWF